MSEQLFDPQQPISPVLGMSTTLAPRHINLLPILPGSSPNVSLPPAPDETSASSEAII